MLAISQITLHFRRNKPVCVYPADIPLKGGDSGSFIIDVSDEMEKTVRCVLASGFLLK